MSYIIRGELPLSCLDFLYNTPNIPFLANSVDTSYGLLLEAAASEGISRGIGGGIANGDSGGKISNGINRGISGRAARKPLHEPAPSAVDNDVGRGDTKHRSRRRRGKLL